MDFRKTGEEVVAKAIKWGAGEAEARLENVKSFEVNVRKGEIETLKRSVSRGLGLRVFIDRQLGFAYTSDLSAGAVDETVKKAIELARTSSVRYFHANEF
jgi:PmbA protein